MESDKNRPSPDQLAQQLTDLSRQIVETRNQMIKTSNILGNLSAEVKEISRQHQQQKKGLTLNSVAAYVLFVVLISVGFFFVYRAGKERLDYEKGVLVREHAAARSKLETLQKAMDRRKEAEAGAAAFYRLTSSGDVHKALKQYPAIAQLPLSPVESSVFSDWASRNQSRLAYAAYSSAMKAIEESDWKRAALDFKRSLRYQPHPPHEASLRYYLGIALMKLGSYPEAADELERALTANAEKFVSSEIRFHLGTIYEQMGQFKKARSAYQEYIRKHPHTSFARVSKNRLKGLD